MRDVRVVWLWWIVSSVVLRDGEQCMPSALIWRSTAVTLSFSGLDFSVELAANSFELGTALAFVVLCSQGCFHCESPISLQLKVR
jgi:hypothetical protein